MERLAQRRLLVDPERLCTPRVPPARCLPPDVRLPEEARGKRPGGGGFSAVRRAEQPARAIDLSRVRHGPHPLPCLRAPQARHSVLYSGAQAPLAVENMAADARDALALVRPLRLDVGGMEVKDA